MNRSGDTSSFCVGFSHLLFFRLCVVASSSFGWLILNFWMEQLPIPMLWGSMCSVGKVTYFRGIVVVGSLTNEVNLILSSHTSIFIQMGTGQFELRSAMAGESMALA